MPERREGPRHGGHDRTGGVTALGGEFFHPLRTRRQRVRIAARGFRQRDVPIGERHAGIGEMLVREIPHDPPIVRCGRETGKFRAPQERRAIHQREERRHDARPGRDDPPEHLVGRVGIARLQGTQRQMPTDMPVHQPVTRVIRQPGFDEGPGRRLMLVLVTDMRQGVRPDGVGGMFRHRTLNLLPGACVLPGFGQGEGVIGGEPPIVAIMRRQPLRQCQLFLLQRRSA